MNPRIAKLPKYKGIPIVFFASIDKHGIPDFKITDEEKRMRCAKERLCWICGEKLTWPVCFIGGPHSIEHGLFNDGPMHADCARDSMEMCPWLCGQMDYAPPESFKLERHDKDIQFTGDILSGRAGRQRGAPDRVGIYFCDGFEVAVVKLPDGKACWFFKALPPLIVDWRERRPRPQSPQGARTDSPDDPK